jgi:hypothetical protein
MSLRSHSANEQYFGRPVQFQPNQVVDVVDPLRDSEHLHHWLGRIDQYCQTVSDQLVDISSRLLAGEAGSSTPELTLLNVDVRHADS